MKLKGLLDEDFVNYKKASMFVIFPYCTFKCEKECGITCCQNSELANADIINFDASTLVERYVNNPLTHAIVCGGMEPFDTYTDLIEFIRILRSFTSDDVVIYTGYNENEIQDKLDELKQFENIVIKFGRFIPNDVSHFDEVLGVTLASHNQYAKRIS